MMKANEDNIENPTTNTVESPPPEAARVDLTAKDSSTSKSLDDYQVPIAGVFLAAVILLIAVVSDGGPSSSSRYYGYGIALAAVAMVLSIVTLGLINYAPEESQNGSKYALYFLFVWNFVGACVLTFGDGPFTITSNGYFGVWGMVVFSVAGLGVASSVNVKDTDSLMGHFAAALVVLIALCSECCSNHKNETIYGLILACLSIVVLGFHIGSEHAGGDGISNAALFPVLLILAICWIVSACLLTFRGPFLVTGNGYFGAWGGALTSVLAAMAAKNNWK